MRLLRRNGGQGETLLKLEEIITKTKCNLEKLTKEHEELVCSHGNLVQKYGSLLIEQINNENALSSIAQVKFDNAMFKDQVEKSKT
jgi:carbamate kinase